MDTIGIFPLGIVLFPESLFPLHIFEERYKNLVRDCLEKGVHFGINLNLAAKVYDVGCSAEIVNVMHEYSDGKIDITVAGRKRYKMQNNALGQRLYNIADVEYFEDNPGAEGSKEEAANETLDECINYYNRLSDLVKSIKIDKIDRKSLSNEYPSFLLAQKSGMSLKQKQELLEMKSENKRLIYLKRHLKEILPMLKSAEAANQIIKNDGYFKP